MKYSVILSPEALNDINDIYTYIAVTLSEKEIAAQMVRLIENSILSLNEMPNRFKRYNEEPWKSRGLRVMNVKKYLIFYIPHDDIKTVDVLRVIYGSRDIDKHLN